MIYNVYFSPTFTTKRLVKLISNEGINIELNEDFKGLTLNSDDILYLGVPSYGGRVPLYALDKIKLIKGNSTRAILLVSFGNRAIDDTLAELYDLLKANGFITIAGIEAVSRHSIFREIAKNRPDEADLKELREYKRLIDSKLLEASLIEPVLPGNRPYKERKPGGLIPRANSNCISCGKCARMCPVGAIDMNNPKITRDEACIHCMRCIEVCEFNGRAIDEKSIDMMMERLGPLFAKRKQNHLYI